MEYWGIGVEKMHAEMVRRLLTKHKLIVLEAKPVIINNLVFFPVKDPIKTKKIILNSYKLESIIDKLDFPIREKRPSRLSTPMKGYVIIGDIALFSWVPDYSTEEYRKAGVELLKTNKRIRSVWLKKSTVGDERVPHLIHLAGEKKTRTIAREYGIPLHVDISKAYYNPRLAGEHRRIAELVQPGEKILDMFTGIGGFPIHIGVLRKAFVIGIDINKYALELAVKTLESNRKRLKGIIIFIQANSYRIANMFKILFNRIILNLPSKSPEFALQACTVSQEYATHHYYILARSCKEAIGRIKDNLAKAGCVIITSKCRDVIDYSPRTYIYSIDIEVKKNGIYNY